MDTCSYCGVEIRPDDTFCLNCGTRLLFKTLHNRYQIFEEVGEGGMGKIYKARDSKLGNRHVAVKELKLLEPGSPEKFEEASHLFEQEALLLARLSHPSLPHIYDHFSQDNHWYFVMEYIDGQTLTQYLHTMPGMRLPPDEVISIGIKLCAVLGYLHSQASPIVYGDLKPGNIIITAEHNLYLIDFGIARFLDQSQPEHSKFVSPGYSPPEQYHTANISPRADIYSLGATLYQMLSGRHPPMAQFHFAPLPLGHQLWMVDLEMLVMSMVAQEEQKRPQNITIILQALQRIEIQRAQELNTLQNLSRWNEAPQAQKEQSFFQTATPVDAFASHSVVTFRDIQLSLDDINALEWSPDGKYLAAAKNGGEVHIYSWPPEERAYESSAEPVLPVRTWSLKEEQQGSWSEVTVLTWSPDSTHLAATVNATLFLLDISGENPLSTYTEHKGEIRRIAWSPNGDYIASVERGEYNSFRVYVWEVKTGRKRREYQGGSGYILSALAWSSNSTYLAFAMYPGTIVVPGDWEEGYRSSNLNRTIFASDDEGAEFHDAPTVPIEAPHPDERQDIIPPPPPGISDGPLLDSTSDQVTVLSIIGVHVIEATGGDTVCKYHQDGGAYSVLWLSNGTDLVSCGDDGTIHIWNMGTGQTLWSLEGHTDRISRMALFDHGRLLASCSDRGDVYLWDIATWAPVESFRVEYPAYVGWGGINPVAFHPVTALVATFGPVRVVRLYEIDTTQFYASSGQADGIQYTNAKVVLLGDSGVGKSGLGLVLSRQHFEPTESTHGRLVWTFSRQESHLPDGRREIQETLLWDLAGQPGYRLIHQLHLSEVTVALVVFDAHSETDPFAGIVHWVRALRTAQRVRGNMGALKMLLVLARIDRGGKRASRGRIEEIIQKSGFDAYFETSAKEGTNIAELSSAIENAINWEHLPKVTSTELFRRIRTFLIAEKQVGRLLTTQNDLYRTFLKTWSPWGEEKDLSAEFATGTRLLESNGLIRQLSFGNLVLLQPELLDTYASALVNAVRDEPDGLGSILEEAVGAGNFSIPRDERIADREQEKLLLIAMVEDLLSYEIALREQGEEGPYLVFPSESTRENPALPDPENASIVFTFEGPVLNIYATLAVRLSHSNLFVRKELWKDAVIYETRLGGTSGIWLKLIEDGKGELTLFFDEHMSQEMRFHFEEYVQVHLQRKALPESIQIRRIHRCECGFTASNQLVHMRKERGFNWFTCPVCETRVDLRDPSELLRRTSKSQVSEMDRAADVQRARATARLTVQGKQETSDFDVLLCYNAPDQTAVIEIAERLGEQGILPWLDVWELRPGLPWQRQLEQQIQQIKSAAVFVGKEGIGPWQQQEIESLLRQFVHRGCPVIPVILSSASSEPELPIFLEGMTWVDFRKPGARPIEQLIWGITGKRSIYRS